MTSHPAMKLLSMLTRILVPVNRKPTSHRSITNSTLHPVSGIRGSYKVLTINEVLSSDHPVTMGHGVSVYIVLGLQK